MPRNSLTNGKQAPDSFNTQLDECAYPLIMALAVGLTGRDYYTRTSARRRTSSPPTARRSARSAGRSRTATRPRRSAPRSRAWSPRPRSPRSTATATRAAVWRGVADEFQRNLKTWTLTTNGPASPNAVLHPAVEDRRPERRDHLQRRQRRPDARPARGDRRRLPRVRPPRPAEGQRPGHRPLAAASSTRRSSAPPPTATASCATTATATATGRPTATRGRRRTRATATSGRCWRASAASGSSARATPPPPSSARRRWPNMGSGVGLIPEQAWEVADLPRSPFGTDPTIASIGFSQRRAGRLGRGADVVGGPVRAADADHRLRRRARHARLHRRPLRQAHAGHDGADRHRARRPLDRRRPRPR